MVIVDHFLSLFGVVLKIPKTGILHCVHFLYNCQRKCTLETSDFQSNGLFWTHSSPSKFLSFFFFLNKFIYLFNFGCVGSS